MMMPVSLITRNLNLAPVVVAVHGSLRAGTATLAHGYTLRWTSGINLFALPHLGTDFILEGADTRMVGIVQTGISGINAKGVEGRAGPGLAQLVPGAWACEMTARVLDVGFSWGWRKTAASGSVTTPEGICARNDREILIPPLALDLRRDGVDAVVTLTSVPETLLAQIHVRRSRVLEIAIRPAAASVFPQLPRGGPINLQLPF